MLLFEENQALEIRYLKPMLKGRNYPYSLRATTRTTDYTKGGEYYPGGFGDMTTYMTESYCLGSASRLYCDGDQTNGLVAEMYFPVPVDPLRQVGSCAFDLHLKPQG